MRVLILSNLYPSTRFPTRGMFNLNGFLPLAEHCEVRLAAPVPWWSRLRRLGELLRTPRETHTGIDTCFPSYWSIPRVAPGFHARAMYLSLRPYVRRLRREFPFDIILAAWLYPDAVAAAHLAQEFDCPLVSMALGSDINELATHPAARRQIQWALQRSQRVITVSSALRERVLELGIAPERVLVQHNGVDGKRFTLRDRTELRRRLDLPLERPLVGYVGNFQPEKGVDVLVEAFGRLQNGVGGSAELALVGDGPLLEPLRTRARELGIAERVRFAGRRLHGEVPDWISACDVFCLPSRREGCPNVVLEALASGRPVVATAVGGVPELLNPENGILVPSEDPGALARGLEAALGREWEPEALRASVGCLSWEAFGQTLRDTLAAGLCEWNGRSVVQGPVSVSGQSTY